MICNTVLKDWIREFSYNDKKNKKAPSEDTILPKVLFLYPVSDYEYSQQL